MWNLVPLILETGTDAIAGLQPPDMGDVLLPEMKARYGNKVALVGGLDPVYAFDLGTPQTAGKAVRQAIAGAGGGYILRESMGCSPQTPAASIAAAVEAAKEFGCY